MKSLSGKEKLKKFNAALNSFCSELEKRLNKNYEARSKELSAVREIKVASREVSKINRIVEYQLWDKKSGTELVLAAKPLCFVNVSDGAVVSVVDRKRIFDDNIEDIKISEIEKFANKF